MIGDPESMPMVDVSFAINADTIARDSAFHLRESLCAAVPWLAEDRFAGIHPLKVVAGTEPRALLSARARLWLRVRRERAADLESLANRELTLGGQPLHLGAMQVRELVPHGTLYAYRVAAANADELAFMTETQRMLQDHGLSCQPICGRHQQIDVDGSVQHVFSLMVHGLGAEASRHLQEMGLGPHRLLGCGLFVPHKSASAV